MDIFKGHYSAYHNYLFQIFKNAKKKQLLNFSFELLEGIVVCFTEYRVRRAETSWGSWRINVFFGAY